MHLSWSQCKWPLMSIGQPFWLRAESMNRIHRFIKFDLILSSSLNTISTIIIPVISLLLIVNHWSFIIVIIVPIGHRFPLTPVANLVPWCLAGQGCVKS